MRYPLPVLNPDTQAFWTSGALGRLMIHRCHKCRRWSHPPSPVCRWCHSMEIGPEESVGSGSVLTFTVNRQPWQPEPPVPYVIAVVELDDEPGLRLTTRLVNVDPEVMRAGMRVIVCFEAVEDIWLPLFKPIHPK